MSIDGYLGTGTEQRLLLSNDADFDRVDAVRASCDAILVGAATVRQDDPRLLVRCPARREARVARGLDPSPTKVTITSTAALDPRARFFTDGDAAKLVYCPPDVVREARVRLGAVATVVGCGSRGRMRRVSEDLQTRGVRRLMVEGGGVVLTQFLADALADELQLAVAPLFVGDRQARRLVGDATFPWTADSRATLADVRQVGDVAVMRFALSPRFAEEEGNRTEEVAAGHDVRRAVNTTGADLVLRV